MSQIQPTTTTKPEVQEQTDKVDFTQLAAIELEQINHSRQIRRRPQLPLTSAPPEAAIQDTATVTAPLTALCISGGGVRSATFATGVINTLSQGATPALAKMDYMSTVSGGGYLGSFIGLLFHKNNSKSHDDTLKLLSDRQSGPMRYLKQRGRFLADSGDEALQAATVLLRNLFWLHLRLALLLLPVFTLLFIAVNVPAYAPSSYTSNLLPEWLNNKSWLMQQWHWLLAFGPTAVCLLSAFWWGGAYFISNRDVAAGARRRELTELMAKRLYWAAGLLFVFGGSVAVHHVVTGAVENAQISSTNELSQLISWLLGLYALIVGLSGTVYKIYKTIQSVAGTLLKFRGMLTLAALAVALMYLFIGFSLSMLLFIALQRLYTTALSYELQITYWYWMVGLFLMPLLGHVLLNRFSQSANFTSLHYFYKFRLRRAFLAAANPARYSSSGHNDADWLEEDEPADIRKYQPAQYGGPLHLINITINNSRSPDGKLWWPDCKGKNLAMSGLGYNFDLQYVAWTSPAARPPLELSAAVAISGAAASTGMGQMSSFATSLLTGLFNLRLGYWWPAKPQKKEDFESLFWKEITNQYTADQEDPWYLSDGGHFENLAVYEMLRRRVERMLVVDGGQDQQYQFDDLANLIRRARLDFSCELELYQQAPTQFALLTGHLGSPASLKADVAGFSEHRVLLYKISYPADSWYALRQPAKTGWLLYLKPALRQNDPLDLQQYKTKEPDFPHQTTADQFFDETQWESYRKLGEVISQELEPAIQQFLS